MSRAFAAKKAIQPQLDAFAKSLVFVETANDIRAFQTIAKDTNEPIRKVNDAANVSAMIGASELVRVAHEGEDAMRIATTKEDAITRGYKRFLGLAIGSGVLFVAVLVSSVQPSAIWIGGTIAGLSIALTGAFSYAAYTLAGVINSIKDATRIKSGGAILEKD